MVHPLQPQAPMRSAWLGDTVKDVPVFTDVECAEIRASVFGLRSLWRRRAPEIPFFTLGAASYLDAAHDGNLYPRLAGATNAVLKAKIGWIYQRVAERLESELGDRVRFRETAALPGFHIFLEHEAFKSPIGCVHTDVQFQHLDWSDLGEVDRARPISFTIAIALPKTGAGLNRWIVDPDLPAPPVPERREDLTAGRRKTYHGYTRGFMALHSGFDVHQIAPAPLASAGDERITLQGHGLRSGDTWWIYW
jgi:hypothetical protein